MILWFVPWVGSGRCCRAVCCRAVLWEQTGSPTSSDTARPASALLGAAVGAVKRRGGQPRWGRCRWRGDPHTPVDLLQLWAWSFLTLVRVCSSRTGTQGAWRCAGRIRTDEEREMAVRRVVVAGDGGLGRTELTSASCVSAVWQSGAWPVAVLGGWETALEVPF